MTLHPIPLNFLIYEENLFSFSSVMFSVFFSVKESSKEGPVQINKLKFTIQSKTRTLTVKFILIPKAQIKGKGTQYIGLVLDDLNT